jgi:hypothetical protein
VFDVILDQRRSMRYAVRMSREIAAEAIEQTIS